VAPPSERATTVIAAAVLGVLGTLATLLVLMSQVESHYVTRREYEATLVSIQRQLTSIQTTVDRDREIRKADR